MCLDAQVLVVSFVPCLFIEQYNLLNALIDDLAFCLHHHLLSFPVSLASLQLVYLASERAQTLRPFYFPHPRFPQHVRSRQVHRRNYEPTDAGARCGGLPGCIDGWSVGELLKEGVGVVPLTVVRGG